MRLLLPALFIFVFAFLSVPVAESSSGVVYGGKVHLRGRVMESACLVMSDADDLSVDMGYYNTSQFRTVGDFTNTAVSFAIKIRQCSRDVADSVILKLNGIPDKSDPDVFSVNHRRENILSLKGGYEDHTGMGLAIFDRNGRIIVPGEGVHIRPGHTPGQMEAVEFTARYRATSPVLTAGSLESVVWLGVVYF